LHKKTQYVLYNETESSKMTIKCGVPQGSILGQLFFMIYMNDTVKACKIYKIVINADDTILGKTIKTDNFNDEHNINLELNLINDWLKLNKLLLNILKIKAMCFHTPQTEIN